MKELTKPIDLIRKSFTIFFEKKNMIYFFKIYSVSFFLSALSYIFGYLVSSSGYVSQDYFNQILKGNPIIILYVIVWSIISFLISLWAQVAGYEAVKRVVDGGSLEFKATFKSSLKYIGRFFLVGFLVGLIVVLGLVLLIVPGIIFATWYAFAIWFVVDKKEGIGQSLKKSKELVKGRFWKVFGRLLVFVLFGMLGQIIFSIIPQGYGSVIATVFGGLFLLPTLLLFKELVDR